MGFFKDVGRAFSDGRRMASEDSYCRGQQEEKGDIPVEIVEPNEGRFITIKIVEKNEFLRRIYMRQLRTYEGCVKNIYPNTKSTLHADGMTFEMPTEEAANVFRSLWAKRL